MPMDVCAVEGELGDVVAKAGIAAPTDEDDETVNDVEDTIAPYLRLSYRTKYG